MKNKDADQTAQMWRLVCDFVVRKPTKTGFLASMPILSAKIKHEQQEKLQNILK